MNEDEPKWIEIRTSNETRFVRMADVLLISKGNSGRILVQTTTRIEAFEADELFCCDFFGRRITDFEFNR